MATNPPVQVGELVDVPAPGSGVKSNWAQEVSNRVVQRFANKAALDAWAAADGSVGYTADFGFLWRRHGGVWKDPYPRGRVATGPAFDAVTVGTTQLNVGTISNVRLFAGRLYTARLNLNGGGFGSVTGDSFNAGHRIDGGAMQAGMTFAIQLANAYIQSPTSFTAFTTTDGLHTFDACVARTSGTGTLQFRGHLDIIDEGPT